MISVVMPTFNRRGFIGKAVQAIIDQDYQDWELIIQNGGESVKDLIPNDTRITDAMNSALNKTKGDIIVWANDDDEITRGSFSFVVDNLHNHKWAYGYIHMNGLGSSHLWGTDWHTFGTWLEALSQLKRNNFIPQPSVYFTREAYEAVGDMDTQQDLTSDYDYWIRLGEFAEPLFMNRIMAKYSIHPDSITVKNTAEQVAQAQKTSQKHAR
jgi:glycosyltransferase involved in cell wall biosynthesis